MWRDLFLTAVEEFVQITVSDKNTPPWIDHEVKHLIRKEYTALRHCEDPTQQRKAIIRPLSQNVKDMIKQKHEEYMEKLNPPLLIIQNSFGHIIRRFIIINNAQMF
ncbi:Hypothetical predicted protein [Paramuricea clavata]|uniref:Uncharacterized protein n=1 Tax=Paramuricea clavata TaxID=317549 RepID=A0A7D9EVQ1_PARCT|nr:Hypothetical predicted protein [Paramuricea clavata]